MRTPRAECVSCHCKTHTFSGMSNVVAVSFQHLILVVLFLMAASMRHAVLHIYENKCVRGDILMYLYTFIHTLYIAATEREDNHRYQIKIEYYRVKLIS